MFVKDIERETPGLLEARGSNRSIPGKSVLLVTSTKLTGLQYQQSGTRLRLLLDVMEWREKAGRT